MEAGSGVHQELTSEAERADLKGQKSHVGGEEGEDSQTSITLDASASGGETLRQVPLSQQRGQEEGNPHAAQVLPSPLLWAAQVQPQASTIMSGMSVLTMLLSRS